MGKKSRRRREVQAAAAELADRLPPWTPFVKADGTDGPAWTQAKDRHKVACYINSRYQVDVELIDTGAMYLSIKLKLPNRTYHDWRDFQRIKNELCGPEREAVELYPAESRLVDTADQYHLWVLPEGESFSFGFHERIVSEYIEADGYGSQRPFDVKPPDLWSRGQLMTAINALPDKK